MDAVRCLHVKQEVTLDGALATNVLNCQVGYKEISSWAVAGKQKQCTLLSTLSTLHSDV